MPTVSVANNDANLSSKTIQLLERDQTVTGLHTYNRGASAPFAVVSGAAKVDNLDADKLDGTEGAAFLLKAGGTMTGALLFTDATVDIGAAGATRPRDIYLSRDLTVGDQIFERGRTTALGEWQTFTFAAGSFTAGGTQTWTVADGDETVKYTLIGKTLHLAFKITTTTVGGTAHPELRLALPASMTVVSGMDYRAAIQISDNGGASQTGLAVAASGAAYVAFYKDMTTNTNWTAATDATAVHGEITIEVA